jgi:hypothetical protein
LKVIARVTYGQPLSIIGLVGGEEGLHGVVSRDDETGKVGPAAFVVSISCTCHVFGGPQLMAKGQAITRAQNRAEFKSGSCLQELAAKVKDDEEEVEGTEADNGVNLGHRSLLLKVVENRVLGKLRVYGISY